MRVILVGSNPSEKSPDCSPFHASTRSRTVVDGWFKDMDVDVHFINVCDRKRSGNRPLKVSEIRGALPRFQSRLEESEFQNCKLVALGKTASKALKMLEVEYHEMPHPSGANRFWNDKAKAAEVIKGLREYLDE